MKDCIVKVFPLLLVALLLVSGCNHSSLPSGAARATQEDDIRAVVFQYQFKNNNSGLQKRAKVYFLSLKARGKDGDPTDSLLRRFAKHEPPVKKWSMSRYSNVAEGVRDRATGEQGVILSVDSIKWKNKNEVEVKGGYFKHGRAASWNIYTFVKKNGRWVVVKDEMEAKA